jgi:hypothetical protein
MNELLEHLIEQDFEDMFEPVSDKDSQERIAPIVRKLLSFVKRSDILNDKIAIEAMWVRIWLDSSSVSGFPSQYVPSFKKQKEQIYNWLKINPNPKTVMNIDAMFSSGNA